MIDKTKTSTVKMIKSRINDMKVPVGLTATSGDLEGEIDLIWEPVDGAGSYVIQLNRHGDKQDGWIQLDIVSHSRYTASRLKSKNVYWFRVAAVNSGGQSIWSMPVNKQAP